MKAANDNLARPPSGGVPEPPPSLAARIKRLLIGPPRDVGDKSVYRRISLVAFLAWVGLGADGLSSSSYGPEEAFRALGEHTYLAVGLAALTAFTIFVIAAAYTRIISHFPHGGGGYVVATKLLGKRAGVVSGSALLVDYALTITVSIAAAGDALFSLLPLEWHVWKIHAEIAIVVFLVILNLRGARESALTLAPVFILFVATHAVLIVGGLIISPPEPPVVERSNAAAFSAGLSTLGAWGMFLLFIHAYSLGGGTYTGIEAVSNGLMIMREPRVRTAKRTMLYMGTSLALTASGLLLCYLLWDIRHVDGKTMNAVLVERFVGVVPLGDAFVALTLLSEGALLMVGAQAGFVDGPRVLANMAVDSWVPRRFSALSERLTTQNGILLMGSAALLALLYTGGAVHTLVVMYSINVFVTFSLSMLGMLRHSLRARGKNRKRRPWGDVFLFTVGLALCVTILVVTAIEKFAEGGWITIAVTGLVITMCFLIRGHYDRMATKLAQLYQSLLDIPRKAVVTAAEPDPSQKVAAVLVSGYGGLGLHTLLGVFRDFPNQFKGVVFLSVGVIDSREFKGEGTIDSLKASVEESLRKYVAFAHSQGIPATWRMAIGTDAVEEGEKLCLQTAGEFPQAIFFAGKILFEKEKWYQKILHNETAFAIQKRLQWAGKIVVVIPARVT